MAFASFSPVTSVLQSQHCQDSLPSPLQGWDSISHIHTSDLEPWFSSGSSLGWQRSACAGSFTDHEFLSNAWSNTNINLSAIHPSIQAPSLPEFQRAFHSTIPGCPPSTFSWLVPTFWSKFLPFFYFFELAYRWTPCNAERPSFQRQSWVASVVCTSTHVWTKYSHVSVNETIFPDLASKQDFIASISVDILTQRWKFIWDFV